MEQFGPLPMLLQSFEKKDVIHQNFKMRLVNTQDLADFSNWPMFSGRELAWANFPATTGELQQRWLKANVKNHLIWMVVSNPEIVEQGSISRVSLSLPQDTADKTNDTVIFGIVIRPDLLSQGLGTLITKITLASVFKLTSYTKIWLESAVSNHRAINTWKKIGFTFNGTHFRMNPFRRYELFQSFIFKKDQQDAVILPKISIEEMK